MIDVPRAADLEPGVLRSILEGTAMETGDRFFAALVRSLCAALQRHGAWVTEYDASARRLRALAFWLGDHWVEDYEYAVEGTPCEPVVSDKCVVHVPDRVVALFPGDPDLRSAGALSYLGVPLLDVDGAVLGHLAVLDTRPMLEEPRDLAVVRIFAARAAAELQRVRAEAELRGREQELSSLVDSAMDGIVALEDRLRITRANAAAATLFGSAVGALAGREIAELLAPASADKLTRLAGELRGGSDHLWIPGGLRARRGDAEFEAEASLSRFELGGRARFTLILRDVEERLEAERRIGTLAAQAEYLRAELDALGNSGEILGRSTAMRRLLTEIEEVAPTDATVLVTGETGTGKELVARAVHARSRRREKPLVNVNCAAIPASLVESELFGHEKGAFTGATSRRLGRFALADGGTIFLDEIGELPIDLQSKLLRVLQEGEIEPVGGAGPRRVDVRVLAATNRDLQQAVRENRFREDLFYRLNVFPIALPPLRERAGDIPLLAQALADRCARRMGRHLEPLTADCIERLEAYAWPGNVRELSNVMERAVITARDGRANVARALPDARPQTEPREPVTKVAAEVLTAEDLEALERANLVRALEQTGWKVAGEQGAAALLGMKPSTLNSRIRALGIQRHAR